MAEPMALLRELSRDELLVSLREVLNALWKVQLRTWAALMVQQREVSRAALTAEQRELLGAAQTAELRDHLRAALTV